MTVVLAIAPAQAADLDAIDEIERHSFTQPWPRETFAAELERDWARLDTARSGDAVVGFCNYWLVVPEIHVLAIATHPDHRGRGIAGVLLAHVLASGEALGCTLATLEVRAGNRPAIKLYERAGFATVHVRKSYYQDNGEDALVMIREIPGR